jgi:hypothetical protein
MKSNLFSFYLVICMGAPEYVGYLLVWLDIFSKSVKVELSRTLICVLKVLKLFTPLQKNWRSQNFRLNIDFLDWVITNFLYELLIFCAPTMQV